MGEDRGVFTYLASATGNCPDCGAAYKWVEVRSEVINGIKVHDPDVRLPPEPSNHRSCAKHAGVSAAAAQRQAPKHS